MGRCLDEEDEEDDCDEAEEIIFGAIVATGEDVVEEGGEEGGEAKDEEAILAFMRPFCVLSRSPQRLFTPFSLSLYPLNVRRLDRKRFSSGGVSSRVGGVDEKCLKSKSILLSLPLWTAFAMAMSFLCDIS